MEEKEKLEWIGKFSQTGHTLGAMVITYPHGVVDVCFLQKKKTYSAALEDWATGTEKDPARVYNEICAAEV